MFPELKRLIEQMGKDKGIEKEVIIEALESAILTAARKKTGGEGGARVPIQRRGGRAGSLPVQHGRRKSGRLRDPDLPGASQDRTRRGSRAGRQPGHEDRRGEF